MNLSIGGRNSNENDVTKKVPDSAGETGVTNMAEVITPVSTNLNGNKDSVLNVQ